MHSKGSIFEGKTLDDAVRKGLEALGLSRAEVMITVVEEGSGGFLGLGARPYRVRMMPRPGGAAREPAERGRRERAERTGRERPPRGGREARPLREGGRPGARPERGGRPSRPERGGRPERPERGGRPEAVERGDRGERADRGGRGPSMEERRAPGDRRERYPQNVPAEERRGGGERRVESAMPRGDADDRGRRRRRGRRGGRGRGEGFPERERMPREETRLEPDPATARGEPLRSQTMPRPERIEREFEPRTATTTEEGPAMASGELAALGEQVTVQLLQAMGFEARVSSRAEDTHVDVTAEVAEGEELLTGRKGEVRQALQHLLNRMINRGGGSRYHLQLEINDFWQRRERELEGLARALAEQAIASGGEQLTEYLNAQERRIVHVTLKEDPRVKTYAIGDGLIKKVAIAPADEAEASKPEG